jgi:hypothetical protein
MVCEARIGENIACDVDSEGLGHTCSSDSPIILLPVSVFITF